MNLLVFAGTTEGSDFVQKALAEGHTITVSVATQYGSEVLQKHLSSLSETSSGDADSERLHILQGRLDSEEIASLLPHFDALVDATHPYAEEITKNLLAASSLSFVPYYRLLRPLQPVKAENLHEFENLSSLAEALSKKSGNVFLSTGSRDLAAFTKIPDYQKRLFVRVLPLTDSIEKCRALGFSPDHIIAMQGVGSRELNKALFAEYNCRVLVTKESGEAGGFAEKIAAAEALGMDIFALKAPAEPENANCFGSAEELLSALRESDLLGTLTDFLGD